MFREWLMTSTALCGSMASYRLDRIQMMLALAASRGRDAEGGR